jgi:predicted  nucleic acid-binding Zn-ribbon protein
MAGPAVFFREIHRLRRQARDIQDQIDRIPRQLRAQQTRITGQETALREAQEHVRHLKVTAHEKEVELKSRQTQITKFQRQLNESESKKEYDALQAEIATAKSDCQQLEDEILNAMIETDERTAELPALEKALQQAREEAARFEREAGSRRTDLTGQVTALRTELRGVEANIPAGLVRDTYNRIAAAKDADALAVVRDRTCTACHTEITTQSYHELKRNQFFCCKSCARILYLPAEETTEEDENEA